MSHIFISYSRRDVKIVDQFVGSLDQEGANVWIDREDIKVGNSWRVQIVEAIDTCDAFVLMLSSNSAASTNVHKEVILAQDSSRPLYVVMLEEVRVPAEIRYQLAGLQFINVPLLGFERSTKDLVEALKPYLKKITPKSEDSHKQVELVIQGIDLSAFTPEKQQELLAFVASLTSADASQLRIANMTAGSVHIFVDMPADAAYRLKTLALNADPRFTSQNIVSLRLEGNKLYIHTAQGILSPLPKPNPVKAFFSTIVGKIVMILAVILILVGLTTFAPSRMEPPASDPTVAWSATPLPPTPTVPPSVVPSETATEIPTQTSTPTPIPTETPTPTSTPIVYEVFTGVVRNERTSCRYGPGIYYLDDETLRSGIKLQVFGRDVNSGWVYVHPDGYQDDNDQSKDKLCWVDFSNIEMDGELEKLEPVYPGKVSLPISYYWDPPQNVYTARTRDGRQIAIYWDPFILPDGEMESPQSPRYLLELWLCKGGELVFTPWFTWQDDVLVPDEPGCSEPSSGVIYLVEKHGYSVPAIIPWTPAP